MIRGVWTHWLLPAWLLLALAGDGEHRYAPRTLAGVLGRARVVAHVEVVEAARAAPGTALLRLHPIERLLDRRAHARQGEILALAAPGQYMAGADYLVFLAPLPGSERLVALRRIAGNDREFGAKLALLRELCRLEAIEDESRRLAALRDLWLDNLLSEDRFLRWNAVVELDGLLRARPRLFGPGERRRLAGALERAAGGRFRRAVERLVALAGGAETSKRSGPERGTADRTGRGAEPIARPPGGVR